MLRRIFLLVGIALLAGIVYRLGVAQITATLTAIGWRFLLIVALFLGHQMARAAALGHTVAPGARPRFIDLLAVRLSGEAVDYTVVTGPILAEPVKGWLLSRGGVPIPEAYGGVAADYIVYSMLSAVLAIGGLLGLMARAPGDPLIHTIAKIVIWILAGFVVVVTLAIVTRTYVIGWAMSVAARLPLIGSRISIAAADVRMFEDRLIAVLRDRPKQLAIIAGFESLAHALQVLEIYVVLNALGLAYAPADPIIIEGGIKFTPVAFFFIPGALGAAEGIYILLFKALGLGATAGFSLGFVRRVRALVIAGIGLYTLARLSRTQT